MSESTSPLTASDAYQDIVLKESEIKEWVTKNKRLEESLSIESNLLEDLRFAATQHGDYEFYDNKTEPILASVSNYDDITIYEFRFLGKNLRAYRVFVSSSSGSYDTAGNEIALHARLRMRKIQDKKIKLDRDAAEKSLASAQELVQADLDTKIQQYIRKKTRDLYPILIEDADIFISDRKIIGTREIVTVSVLDQDGKKQDTFSVIDGRKVRVFREPTDVIEAVSGERWLANLSFDQMRLYVLAISATFLTIGLIIALVLFDEPPLEIVSGLLGTVLGYIAGKGVKG